MAAETESLRNTLLASISHDLRTPLSVIAGASSTLAERGLTLDEGSRVELARSIEVKAHEMSELVSNVLDLMRFESGQIDLRRDWQALDDLVGSALSRMEDRLRDRPIEVSIPADLPAVHVDAGLVVQVFVNLLDNVLKFTLPDTRMCISAQQADDFVRVYVDDEGPGLPAAQRERLFDKFQRGKDEGSVAGVGLGLAICRAVVAAHGGEIRAGEAPGGGARFQFTLPTHELSP